MVTNQQNETDVREEREGKKIDWDNRALAIGLTILIHLMILWLLPSEVIQRTRSSPPPEKVFEIQLEPLVSPEENEERYVRAAPNVPEEVPESTLNISDRDQVAAQPEEALPDPENTPAVEGDMEDSNRIVQGDPRQISGTPGGPAVVQATGESSIPEQQPAPRERSEPPSPEWIEQMAEEDEGIASTEVARDARELEENPTDQEREPSEVVSPLDGRGEAQAYTPPQSASEEVPTPRPRVRIEQDNSFGPIKLNRTGAVRIGNLSFDAQYSEFGEYWTRVAEIIEARWRNLVYNTRSLPRDRSQVRIRFFITRTGEIDSIETIYTNSTRLAETIASDAILSSGPFFDWTPEMILRMGERAECSIAFFY